MKNEYNANLALAKTTNHGWKVGANFAKPMPKRKPVSMLAKLLTFKAKK